MDRVAQIPMMYRNNKKKTDSTFLVLFGGRKFALSFVLHVKCGVEKMKTSVTS